MTDIPDYVASLERIRDRIKSNYTGSDQEDRDLMAIARAIRALRATQWVPIADTSRAPKQNCDLMVVAKSLTRAALAKAKGGRP